MSEPDPTAVPATDGPPGAAVTPRRDTWMDSWNGRYATRTHGVTASAVRSLFEVANRPEVVSLAGGMPNIADLPLDVISDHLAAMVAKDGARAMQYGSGQGEPLLREQVTEVMRLEGIHAHRDDITLTVGSQQGLDLVTRIFCDPGDVVLVEAPSYVGALGTFRSYQCDVVHVGMDGHGLDPEALRATVLAQRAAGRRVKFVYTIPNFQNPAGVTQPLERRHALLAVAHELDLLLVEDNPYGLLTFSGEPIPAIRSLEADRVIYLGSFSKTFSPGVRVGWVLAPHAVREKLVLAQEAATLCPPVFSQFVVSTYLSTSDWQGQIVSFRDMYRTRRDALLAGLEEFMPPGTTWTRPEGGFFVWLSLPEGLDSQAMLPRAITSRVAYVPGPAFFADGLGARHMRVSYCYPPPERLREGARRLGQVLTNELALHETFGLGSGANAPARGVTRGPGANLS